MNQYQSPFLEKLKKKGDKLGLESVYNLLSELDDPENRIPSIIVAGTNGKGSTCCYISSVLKNAGYRTGVFTSPQVFSYEERFRVDDHFISPGQFSEIVSRIESAYDRLCKKGLLLPTIFEAELAIALLYFIDEDCDIVILEAGMGGDLDAVNVVSEPLLSVFTSIGMDHMEFLGNSPGEIARHKAGIMRNNGMAVSIWQEEAVEGVLRAEAKRQQVDLTFADRNLLEVFGSDPIVFSYDGFKDISLGMSGHYQIKNAISALLSVNALQSRGFEISGQDIKKGLKEALWPGRMECISKKHNIYIDGAHNVPAAWELIKTIEMNLKAKSITFVIGIFADKDYKGVVSVLARAATHIITITPPHPRGLCANELKAEIDSLAGISAEAAEDYSSAARWALSKGDDVIIVAGSLSILKVMKDSFLKELADEYKNRSN